MLERHIQAPPKLRVQLEDTPDAHGRVGLRVMPLSVSEHHVNHRCSRRASSRIAQMPTRGVAVAAVTIATVVGLCL